MLVKWNQPASPSFSRLLDDFFTNDLRAVRGFDAQKSVPAVNIAELEDQFRIELAAPGLNKEDFSLQVEKDQLVVKAQKEAKAEETTEKYTRREFSYQTFQRSFTLTDTIDREGIAAVYENGVLNITLPKLKEAIKTTRLVEVQ